jgi:hypothetical protein
MISPTEGLTFSHREYQNDVLTQADKSLALRVSLTAAPFISLYAPMALPLAITLGSFRVWSHISELCTDKNPKPLHTALSIVALAAIFFTPVLGFALTTSQDLLIERERLSQALLYRDKDKILKSCITIISNSAYLALLASGSPFFSILALTSQCLAESIYGLEEFGKENYLEATGHLLMGCVRSSELLSQLSVLSTKEVSSHRVSCLQTLNGLSPIKA